MKLSLCVVAYNEEERLPALLSDIAGQSYPKKNTELLLIDGGSGDGTRKQMEQFARDYGEKYAGILVLDNPGKILSCGWNVALVHFTGDAILRVDAHSHIPSDFIEKNVETLQGGEMVSGGARPVVCEGEKGWQRTLLLAEESLFGSSISSFRRNEERAYVKSLFHGAYRREVFEAVGGFREDLGRTEDNEIHYRIRKKGYRLCMSPDIRSYQYIRPTLGKMCRQKYGNGYWIGLTAGVCPGCLSLYYFVPGAFIGGIVLTTIAALCGIYWPALLMWGAYLLLAVTMAMLAVRGKKKSPSQFLLPVLFFLLHISYGAGTWLGLVKMPFWRRHHRSCPSVERVKEQMKHGRETA
ncbi:MAG: glycosyltransferase family 2 protein [Lachnospiraceae bacterium]|nr:glycosyltransferase family 2 protein [Lachnospiraceae bacterium]